MTRRRRMNLEEIQKHFAEFELLSQGGQFLAFNRAKQNAKWSTDLPKKDPKDWLLAAQRIPDGTLMWFRTAEQIHQFLTQESFNPYQASTSTLDLGD